MLFLNTFPYMISSDLQGIDFHFHFTDGESESQRLLARVYTALYWQTQGKSSDLLIPSVMVLPMYHVVGNCIFSKLKD